MALAERALGVGTETASTNGATTLSISPTGMQEGDWLIFGVCSAGGSGAHSNTAGELSRATAADIAGGTVTVASTWKKKCGAGEAGPYTFSFGGSTRRAVIGVICYSGGDATDIVESAPAGVASGAGDSSLAVPGVDPTATGGVHLVWAFSRTAGGDQQDFDAITDYPEQFEVSSTHATSANANLALSARALPDAAATGDITFSVVIADRLSGASVLLKPAGGLSAAVGQVTETDTAQALARLKTDQLGQVTETDTAQPIVRVKVEQLGQATETDTAQVVTRLKTEQVGQTIETDTAQPIGRTKTLALGQAIETDTAQVITPVQTGGGQSAEIAQVSETDTAQAVTAVHVAAVGQATETDTAAALDRLKTQDVNVAVETDTAQPIGEVRVRELGLAAEIDTAGAVARLKTEQLGVAAETDTAQAVVAQRVYPVGVASETDTAQPTGRLRTEQLGQATETDSAEPLSVARTYPVATASEVDTALPLGHTKTAQVGQAVETDTAETVTAAHVGALGVAVETDTAQAMGTAKTRELGRASEVDSAGPLGGVTPVDPVQETDTAGQLGRLKTSIVQLAAEVDTAGALDSAKTVELGVAVETDTAGAVSAGRAVQISPATETDTAGVLGTAKIVPIGSATETDTALPITATGGAPEPVPEVDLMTLAFIIVTGIGVCVRDALEDTEGGVPDRVCLAVPGDIAWDSCECGQFAQSITGDAPSRVFPIPATEVAHNACGPPLLIFTVNASVTRCVPTLDDHGRPPSCDDLLVAARMLEDDREALRRSITCCLRDLRTEYRITDFAVGATQTVGPQGMCAGVQMSYQFGLNYTCC